MLVLGAEGFHCHPVPVETIQIAQVARTNSAEKVSSTADGGGWPEVRLHGLEVTFRGTSLALANCADWHNTTTFPRTDTLREEYE